MMIRLSAAPRAFDIFDTGSWGFAALHPRLYAVGRSAGSEANLIRVSFYFVEALRQAKAYRTHSLAVGIRAARPDRDLLAVNFDFYLSEPGSLRFVSAHSRAHTAAAVLQQLQ